MCLIISADPNGTLHHFAGNHLIVALCQLHQSGDTQNRANILVGPLGNHLTRSGKEALVLIKMPVDQVTCFC